MAKQQDVDPGNGRLPGGVQSIARAFDLLEMMADLDGVVGISQLATRSGLPLPTIHRLMRTLVDLGYVRQEANREYALGPGLVRLGQHAGRMLGNWATPYLQRVVDAVGESANMAMIDGYQVIFTAQVPGRHAMRMFTEVGRRAGIHCTAVGKAMLATLPADRAGGMLHHTGLPAQTAHTITSLRAMDQELERIRLRGYAVDNEEQEIGVRCVAVSLPGEGARAAISISGPSTRMTDTLIGTAVPLLTETAASLATELDLADATTRRAG